MKTHFLISMFFISCASQKLDLRHMEQQKFKNHESEFITPSDLNAPMNLACYYYDPVYPYDSYLPKRKWVWGQIKDQFYELLGKREARFYVLNKEFSYENLLKVCHDSIPKNHQILKMSARFSSVNPREFELDFNLSSPKMANFKRILMFGDSLSDSGNLQNFVRILGYPYFMGRMTNHRVWVEYFSHFLNNMAVDNWSYAGSVTSQLAFNNTSFKNLGPKFFKMLTGSTYENVKYHLEKYPFDDLSQDLYIFWDGANNYGSYLSNKEEVDSLTKISFQKLVYNNFFDLEEALSLLYKKGLRHFLILPLADFADLPSVKNTKQEKMGSWITQQHNKYLTRWIQKIKKNMPLLNVSTLSMIDMIRKLKEPKFGFKNQTESCYSAGWESRGSGTLCKNPNEYIFFDTGGHPTARVHCLISIYVLKQLTEDQWTELTADQIENFENKCLNNEFFSI